MLDSFAESKESTLRNPPARSQLAETTCREAIESARVFRLTKLPLLPYPSNIEELRPEEPLAGAFVFSNRGP